MMEKFFFAFTFFCFNMLAAQISITIRITDTTGMHKKMNIELINNSNESYAIPIDRSDVRGNGPGICSETVETALMPTVNLKNLGNYKYLEYDYQFASGNSETFNQIDAASSRVKRMNDIFIGLKPKERIIYELHFNPVNFNNKILYHELFYLTPYILYDLDLSICISKKAVAKFGKRIKLNGEFYTPFYGKIQSNKVMVQWTPEMFIYK